jgi:tetratricopeptide (TPR) repeat protein
MGFFMTHIRIAVVVVLLAGSVAVAQTQAWQEQLAAGRDAIKKGMYSDAEAPLKGALAAAAAESVEFAECENELGKLYRLTAQYDLAESFDHKALELQEKLLGKNDPAVATTLENIGELETIRANFKASGEALNRALDIRTKALGEENADTAETMSNLGYFDLCVNNLADADKLCRRALEIDTGLLDADDPRLAFAIDNVGNVVFEYSHYTETETLWTRALHIRTRALGEDHPDVGLSYDNLGWLYMAWGDSSRSRRYFNLARFTRENALGAGHPDTIESHSMYVELSDPDPIKPDQSAAMQEKDLQSEIAIWGPDHWFVQWIKVSLAQTYIELNRPDDALKEYQQALATTRRTMGEEHLNTASVEAELADFDRQYGNSPVEAEQLYKQALATTQKLLGKDDHSNVTILEGYADLLKTLHRDAEAGPMLDQAHAIEAADQQRDPLNKLEGSGL